MGTRKYPTVTFGSKLTGYIGNLLQTDVLGQRRLLISLVLDTETVILSRRHVLGGLSTSRQLKI